MVTLNLPSRPEIAGLLANYGGIVQRVSFVGYTGGEGGSPRLRNLQNLHAVPP